MNDGGWIVGAVEVDSWIYVVPSKSVDEMTDVWEACSTAHTWSELSGMLTDRWRAALGQHLQEARWDGQGVDPSSSVEYLGWSLTQARPDLVSAILLDVYGDPLEGFPQPFRDHLGGCGRYFEADALFCVEPEASGELVEILDRSGVIWEADDKAIERFLGIGWPYVRPEPRRVWKPAPRWGRVPPPEAGEDRILDRDKISVDLVWADPDRPAWERLRRETLYTLDLYNKVQDLFPRSGNEMLSITDWDENDEAWEAVKRECESLLAKHISEHPEQWDWDLLWEERFKEWARVEGETAGDEEDPWSTPQSKEELEPAHWFEHDEVYTDQIDGYLESSAPIPEDYLPQVSIWLEGTDVELVWKMEADILVYWGEGRYDHPISFPLNEAANAVLEVAYRYVINDPEAIWSLLQRDHALAPHRAHISPSGLVTRKPAAGP